MLHPGCSVLFLAGDNSNKTLLYTFRWRRVSVGFFFRSIMCSNCIAWNDLEIIYVTVRPFGVYFHEPQWRPHAAVRFVLNLCFAVTKPSSSAFASEFYLLLKRGVPYIIHIALVFTTCEVLDKCVIREQSLLWGVYNPGRKSEWNSEEKRCNVKTKWDKKTFKVSWLTDVLLILFFNISFYWQR